MPSPGRVVGDFDSVVEVSSRYQLLMRLASGGMATVFLGRLKGPEGFYRLVAVKRAHAHLLEDPETRRMFLQEARLAALLHHTNVVSVLDIEESVRQLLLVMEYVDGCSLAQLMRRRSKSLPPGVAVRIALDACAGLAAAHALTDEQGNAMGVVHRDVSPHNVLIGRDGVTKLSDFGIAKVLHAGEDQTSAGVIKGKLSYMAPEYAKGQSLDARSDVFGMGVVLWECLAGRRLFRGSGQDDTLKRIVCQLAPALSSLSPELHPLDEVAQVALAKDPEQRYQTAAAMANALRNAARQAGFVATQTDVAEFIQSVLGDEITERRHALKAIIESLNNVTRTASVGPANLDRVASLTPVPAELSDPGSASALGVESVVKKKQGKKLWVLRSSVVAAAFAIVVLGFTFYVKNQNEPAEPSAPGGPSEETSIPSASTASERSVTAAPHAAADATTQSDTLGNGDAGSTVVTAQPEGKRASRRGLQVWAGQHARSQPSRASSSEKPLGAASSALPAPSLAGSTPASSGRPVEPNPY